MKTRTRYVLLILLLGLARPAPAQTVQLEYDLRHTVDARNNDRNYARLSFEVFRSLDYGSLLMKMDADFTGRKNNLGKVYAQVSHALRFWSAPVQLHLEFAGGMGFVGETVDGYPIDNSYAVGAAYPFLFENAWGSTFVAYRLTNFDRPSHDVMYSLWWGKDVTEKISLTAYLVLWTINRNRGDEWTQDLHGKRIAGLSEPQFWYRLNDRFAVGSEIKLFYRVYAYANRVLVYPTLAVRYRI